MTKITSNLLKEIFTLILLASVTSSYAHADILAPVEELRFSVLTTAESSGSLEAMVVESGS